MEDDPAASVFKALADATRRRILDLLDERGGRTLGELAGEFEPAMSRYGVMKHVRVLEDAGLVVTRPDGRRTRHYLNPVPIRMAARRWMDKYAERLADGVLDLRRELETTMTDPTTQLYQVFIRADARRIWEAMTDPDQTERYFHRARMSFTPERMVSHGPDGAVWGDGQVELWDPPHRVVYGWQSLYDPEFADEPTSRVSIEIEPVGVGVCKLTLVHDRLERSPKTAANVNGAGWMFVLSNLKTYVETGEPLRVAG